MIVRKRGENALICASQKLPKPPNPGISSEASPCPATLYWRLPPATSTRGIASPGIVRRLRLFRHISVCRHEIFGDLMQFVPGCVDEVIVAHRKSRADEEFLVRRGPARMIGTDQIPGELEKLNPIERTLLSGSPERRKNISKLGVVYDVDACGELKL